MDPLGTRLFDDLWQFEEAEEIFNEIDWLELLEFFQKGIEQVSEALRRRFSGTTTGDPSVYDGRSLQDLFENLARELADFERIKKRLAEDFKQRRQDIWEMRVRAGILPRAEPESPLTKMPSFNGAAPPGRLQGPVPDSVAGSRETLRKFQQLFKDLKAEEGLVWDVLSRLAVAAAAAGQTGRPLGQLCGGELNGSDHDWSFVSK